MNHLLVFLCAAVLVALGLWLPACLASFGRTARGARLERIKKSPNHVHGSFRNQTPLPLLSEGVKRGALYAEFFFGRKRNTRPPGPLPTLKTELAKLPPDMQALVWFGHASFFLQIGGKKILIDPVLAGHASPLPFVIRAYAGTRLYSPDEIPDIDYIFITHDHWDHLDHRTVLALKNRTRRFLCGLGVGEHLEYWGVEAAKITECDWYESCELDPGFCAHALPAQHFSGRRTKPNTSLWLSWLLESPAGRLYFGGDGGYGPHFAETGKRLGPVDLAILENGQYDKRWKYMHMQPEESLKAAKELGAKRFFPAHSARFCISSHPWDEPLRRISALTRNEPLQLVCPLMGELVDLQAPPRSFPHWWEEVAKPVTPADTGRHGQTGPDQT